MTFNNPKKYLFFDVSFILFSCFLSFSVNSFPVFLILFSFYLMYAYFRDKENKIENEEIRYEKID